MLFRTLPAVMVMAVASQAVAGRVHMPRHPLLARMSTDLLGLESRALDEGYSPGEELCGDGDTCAEACGSGFKQCASTDSMTHCYNPTAEQQCCPGGTGDACDSGFFCSADEQGTTWCCPDGLSLKECAKKYGLPGPLTSEGPTTSTPKSTMKTTTTTKSTSAKKTSTTETTDTTTHTKTPTITKTTDASTHSIAGETASTSPKKSTKIRPISDSTTSVSTTQSALPTSTSEVSTSQPLTTSAAQATVSTTDAPPASTSSVSVSVSQGDSSASATQDVRLVLVGAAGALAAAIL
ncbi:hypothetical protein F5Y18DRAFT_385027 [Xylariaceae sp. FL1019]|nr:hypothetical protein F5Y18DRAFT_385027 [Xylariaceae sp. FL1019]